MALQPTGVFVASRFGAFCESAFGQRIESGLDTTDSVTLRRSITVSQMLFGYIFPEDSNTTLGVFTDDTSRIDYVMSFLYYGGPYTDRTGTTPAGYAGGWGYDDDWMFEVETITAVSTPDPGDGVGTYTSEDVHRIRKKSGYHYEDVASELGSFVGGVNCESTSSSGTGPHYDLLSGTWTITDESISYSASSVIAYREWTRSGDGVTFEVTCEYSSPYTNTDIVGWCIDLYDGKTKTLATIADGSNWLVYYYGASDTLTEASSLTTAGVATTFYAGITQLGFAYAAGEIYGHTGSGGTQADYMCVMRDCEWEVEGNLARYDNTTDIAEATIDQTSELLPFYPPDFRVRYRANVDHWADDTLIQKQVGLLSFYTTPDPDFPVPS